LKDWLDPINSLVTTIDSEIPLKILGTEEFCSPTVFSIPQLPIGATANWSAFPANTIVFSNTVGNQTTVSSNSSSSQGFVTINAQINLSCGNYLLKKQIFVGKPIASAGPAAPICVNQFTQPNPYILPISQGATSYRLVSSSPNLFINGSSEETYNYAPVEVNFMASRAGTFRVDLFTTNACGTSQGAIYVIAESCGGGGFGFRVAQNPVQGESVVIDENPDKAKKDASASKMVGSDDMTVELYDFSGNRLRTQNFKIGSNSSYLLNVRGLPNGNYFVKILNGKEEESHQIIIDR
jgi:hypothetical protein